MSAAVKPRAKQLRASRICRDWAMVVKFNPAQREGWNFAADTIDELYESLAAAVATHGSEYSWGTKAEAALAKARGEQ